MGFFAAIDPADPVVEEICLLCDGLGTAMADAAQIERQGTGAPPKPRAA
jgi:hypothetical protein